MNCLSNLVDLSLCGTNNSLIRITDIPNINIKSLDHLAGQEADNWKNVLTSITNTAAIRVESDMLSSLGAIKVEEGVEICAGLMLDEYASEIYTGRNGITINLKPSTYLQFTLTDIIAHSAIDGQPVTIFVEVSGVNVFSQTYDLSIGENQIAMNLTIPADRRNRTVFIGYDQTAEMAIVINRPCPNACADCGCDCCNSSFTSSNDKTGGIQVLGYIECSINQLICKNAQKLKSLLLNALAVEYILYSIGTDRLNKYTTNSTEKDDPIMVQYQIYEKRYQQALQTTGKSLNLCDDCCFKCKEAIKSVYVCP